MAVFKLVLLPHTYNQCFILIDLCVTMYFVWELFLPKKKILYREKLKPKWTKMQIKTMIYKTGFSFA